MTDFDYDVLQKKRIASGAYHRKGGSKSKKCTLPSDHLTEAQKRKLNGPMTTVQMGQPMAWLDYKGLSDELKKKYLMDVLNSYQPSTRQLGTMLGVTYATVQRELKRLGLPAKLGRGGDYSSGKAKEKAAMWEAFCNGVAGGSNSIIPGANEQIEAQDEQIESEPVQTETQARDLDSTDEEPQVTCYDPEAEIVARSQEWMRELLTQGEPLYSEEKKPAENEAEEAESMEAEPCVTEAPKRTNLTALAARYCDEADAVFAQIGDLMALFGNTPVKVKLSIEVCG